MSIKKFLRNMVRNPRVDLLVGIILLISGVMETIYTLPDDINNWQFGSHHAVILLGLVTLMRSVVDIFAGIEFIDKSAEIQEENNNSVHRPTI